jgi:type IV secretion system protein VirB6
MALDSVNIYQAIGVSVESALKDVSSGAIGSTIGMITATVVLMTTLYYVIMGYMIMSGSVQKPLPDFIKSGIKFIIISSVALTTGRYSTLIGETLEGMSTGIASAWSSTPGTPYAILDTTLNQMFDKGFVLWTRASALSWDDWDKALMLDFQAVMIWVLALVVTLPAAAMVIAAKGILLLLIGVGPFFVAALMFPVTSKWFDAWFGQAMTQIFTIAFICMIASAAMKIVNFYITKFDPNADNTIVTCFLLGCVCILLLWLMYRAGNLAAALGGGVASSAITFGGMAAAAAGMASAVTAPARALNKFDKGGDDKTKFTDRKSVKAYQAIAARLRGKSNGGNVSKA